MGSTVSGAFTQADKCFCVSSGGNFCLSSITGANKSSLSAIRSMTSSNSNVRRAELPFFNVPATSSHVTGVENGRTLLRSQRISIDRRLMIVVLASIDQNFAGPQALLHPRDHGVGKSSLSNSASARARAFVRL